MLHTQSAAHSPAFHAHSLAPLPAFHAPRVTPPRETNHQTKIRLYRFPNPSRNEKGTAKKKATKKPEMKREEKATERTVFSTDIYERDWNVSDMIERVYILWEIENTEQFRSLFVSSSYWLFLNLWFMEAYRGGYGYISPWTESLCISLLSLSLLSVPTLWNETENIALLQPNWRQINSHG